MIFYYSATGNSKWVAEIIAKRTGDRVISVTDCVKRDVYSFHIQKDEAVGFVCPVYFWGLPDTMVKFLDAFEFECDDDTYIYSVLTFGVTTGGAGKMINRRLRLKGHKMSAYFSIRMVDTFTLCFNVANKEANANKNELAGKTAKVIGGKILKQQKGNFDRAKYLAFTTFIAYPFYGLYRKTRRFHVDKNKCVGCGLCAAQCPTRAIEMQDKLPNWIESKCDGCLGCIHKCPEYAISYGKGKRTSKNGQYVNENTAL